MKINVLRTVYFHHELFTSRAAIRVIFGITDSNKAAAIAESYPGTLILSENHGRNLKPHLRIQTVINITGKRYFSFITELLLD